MAEQIYVRHLDPDGLCRAWASGPVEDRLEIIGLADKQLALYREKKAFHRDPLATAEYTRTEEIFYGEDDMPADREAYCRQLVYAVLRRLQAASPNRRIVSQIKEGK